MAAPPDSYRDGVSRKSPTINSTRATHILLQRDQKDFNRFNVTANNSNFNAPSNCPTWQKVLHLFIKDLIMKNKVLSLIATMFLGFVNLLPAQQVFKLAADINDVASSSPDVYVDYILSSNVQFPVVGNVAFFSADDGIHGIELWRTDGTTAGTYMVKDINPGVIGTLVLNITAINDKFYFSVSRDGFKFYPWVSDGTESGTFAIDSTELAASSSPQRFVGLNDAVYMGIDASGFRRSGLGKINEGLNGITYINSLSDNDYNFVRELTEAGELLFFTAFNRERGRALWRSDGTDAGTYKLTDLNNPDGSPTPFGVTNYLTAFDSKLYFSYADEIGFKLGISDGTVSGTGLAPGNNGIIIPHANSIIPAANSFESHFPILNNVLFLSGYNQAGENGLYKYDAANPAGLVLVKDIIPDLDNEQIIASNFQVGDNMLYFQVAKPSTPSQELWRSDGTEAGTTFITSAQSFPRGIYSFHFLLGNLYFVKNDAASGTELWKSDGTPNGTAIIKNINQGTDNSASIQFSECNGKVVFIANEYKSKTGIELWATDGTAVGTKLLKDINTTRTAGSFPIDGGLPASLNDEIVFRAYDYAHGDELYISDGTEKGTRLLNDIKIGDSSSSPRNFYVKNEQVYFVAHPNDIFHPTIYRTNGKPDGLRIITSYYAPNFEAPHFKVTENGLVFFIVRNQVSNNAELWRSNGSLSGTFKIADKLGSELMETVGNSIYFTVGDFLTGSVWKSDGSIAGTKEFWNTTAFIYRMFSFRDRLYFVTSDENNTSLWKTNGTSQGTSRVTEIPGSFSFLESMISGETLYFTTFSIETFTQHLWKTNGTVAGTTELQGEFRVIQNLRDVNGNLFFIARSAEEPLSPKIWKVPFRSSTIELVKDVSSVNGGVANESASVSDKYFFLVPGELVPGTDFSNNILWSSDGTASGTGPVNDPLLNSLRRISRLTAADDKLFFAGDSFQYGEELFVGIFSRKNKDLNFENVSVSKPGDNIMEKDASTNDKLKIFPNPTTNSITVFFQQQRTNDLIITINDQTGRVMIRKKLSAQKGSNSVSFNVESLPAGSYIIKFSDRKERVAKFVKD